MTSKREVIWRITKKGNIQERVISEESAERQMICGSRVISPGSDLSVAFREEPMITVEKKLRVGRGRMNKCV